MRVAFLLSAVTHAAAIGILALIPLYSAQWELAVTAGRPVTLRVSFAAQASVPPEPVTVVLDIPPPPKPVSEPVSVEAASKPDVSLQKQASDSPAMPVTTTAHPELAASSEVRDKSQRTEAVAAPQPAPTTPPTKALERTPPQPRQLSVETSIALATENVVLGAKVDEMPRKMRTNPAPPYPQDALVRREEGRVVLRILIAADGGVEKIAVEKSSGVLSLDNSAISTVKRWRFTPARRAGLAVAYEVLVPVTFSIRS